MMVTIGFIRPIIECVVAYWPAKGLGAGAGDGFSAAMEVIFRANLDFPLYERRGPSAGGAPVLGGDANNLYELSVRQGAFHGNLQSNIHANIMARDHILADQGSYLFPS